MTELSHEARALIEQGRSDDLPSPEDRARIRRRLAAELGGGAIAAATVAGAVASAAPASGVGRAVQGSAAWLKGVVAVATIAGGAALAYVAVKGERPHAERAVSSAEVRVEQAPPAEAEILRAAVPVEATPPEALATPEREAPAVPAPSRREAPRNRRSSRAERAEASASPAAPAPATASTTTPVPATTDAAPGDSVAAELALLAAAQRALRAGDARRALALSQQHRAQFARGALSEERDGIETLARCKLGEQPEASARAFLAQAPSSPLAARVREECGLE